MDGIFFIVLMLIIAAVNAVVKKAGNTKQNVRSRVEEERARVRRQIQERTRQAGSVAREQIEGRAEDATQRAKEIEERLLQMMGMGAAPAATGAGSKPPALPGSRQTPPPRPGQAPPESAAEVSRPSRKPSAYDQVNDRAPKAVTDALTAAEREALAAIKKAERRQPAVVTHTGTGRSSDRYGIAEMFNDPHSARKAMILSEIFGPPRSMQ